MRAAPSPKPSGWGSSPGTGALAHGAPSLLSPLHPPHSLDGAEAAAVTLEPCRGRRPPPAPRPASRGSSCERRAGRGEKFFKEARERRRGGRGREAVKAALSSERRESVPSEGPQLQELPPEPWASHTAAVPLAGPPLLHAASARVGTVTWGWRDLQGPRQAHGLASEWGAPRVEGFGASCVRTRC